MLKRKSFQQPRQFQSRKRGALSKKNRSFRGTEPLEEENEEQESEESEDVEKYNKKGKGKVISREITITHRHDNSHVLSSNSPYYPNFVQDPYYPNKASDFEGFNQHPLTYSHNQNKEQRRFNPSNLSNSFEDTDNVKHAAVYDEDVYSQSNSMPSSFSSQGSAIPFRINNSSPVRNPASNFEDNKVHAKTKQRCCTF
jgi:hypothetical protein